MYSFSSSSTAWKRSRPPRAPGHSTTGSNEDSPGGGRSPNQAEGPLPDRLRYERGVTASVDRALVARRRIPLLSGWRTFTTPVRLGLLGALLGAVVGAVHGPDPSDGFLAFSREAYAIMYGVSFALGGLGVGLLISIVLA